MTRSMTAFARQEAEHAEAVGDIDHHDVLAGGQRPARVTREATATGHERAAVEEDEDWQATCPFRRPDIEMQAILVLLRREVAHDLGEPRGQLRWDGGGRRRAVQFSVPRRDGLRGGKAPVAGRCRAIAQAGDMDAIAVVAAPDGPKSGFKNGVGHALRFPSRRICTIVSTASSGLPARDRDSGVPKMGR